MESDSTAHRKFNFPPFPSAPEHVTIVPFRDFKDNGLKIQEDDYDGPEVDALNIPTVVIEKRHAGDVCKTRSERTMSVVAPQGGSQNEAQSSELPQQRTWLHRWEDLSTRKSCERYNRNQNRADRIHQATRVFNTGRPWPKTDKHVREQWDQFQLYIGILNIMPIWKPIQDSIELEDDADVEDDFDDDEDLFSPDPKEITRRVEMSTERGERSSYQKKNPRPRPPYENYDKPPVAVKSQQEIDQLLQESRERKADRLNEFLNNPKERVQVYLSSYMRKQGLHYVDRNLTLIPLLIRFYINFLVKEEVFSVESEPELIASLHEALIIINLAEFELPLTSQITKSLPWNDVFSGGCEELFDVRSKEQEMSALEWAQRNQGLFSDVESGENGVSSTAAATVASTPPAEEAKELELEVDIDIVTPTTEQNSDDVLETPTQQKNDAPSPVTTSSSSPWGSDEGTAMDNSEPPANTFGSWNTDLDKADPSAAGWGGMELDDITENLWGGDDADTWEIPPPPTLFPILGPTALPLTHTSGIVEWSMRRIRYVVNPGDDNDSSAANVIASKFPSDGPSADAVESDFSSRLSKVVMEPWLDWETSGEEGDTASPQIKGTSRGSVKVYEEGQGVMYEYDSDVRSNAFAAAPSPNGTSLPAHDPLKHTITLLVAPETAKLLRVGMGLGATWVQIARQTDLRNEQEVRETEIEGSGGESISSPDGSGDSDIHGRFWYLSNLLIVLPSFHIV
ncbi:uncharacterized protein C8R40DRAFT_548584 [Lentinula edodes]|uniref:uncharacterized protein n=1 Tax=Lentinula edodes TaxID=5353 RepID=UPI001E8EA533|nr:uncharacterized protein C8R40DRAFT_548584 [Lentinula edodes]KAH7871663.1 hypothetical protein C8R40DRAFT_548584 [Lentinula edodes]